MPGYMPMMPTFYMPMMMPPNPQSMMPMGDPMYPSQCINYMFGIYIF